MGSDQNSGQYSFRSEETHSRNFALTPFFAARASLFIFAETNLVQPLLSTFCTCGLPSGSSPEKFFENTRDNGLRALTIAATRLPKIFQ
jgi:hypothetical protein